MRALRITVTALALLAIVMLALAWEAECAGEGRKTSKKTASAGAARSSTADTASSSKKPAAAAAAAAATKQQFSEEDAVRTVTVLSEANFTRATDDGTWLIMFYAPWCQHCQAYKPVFAQASARIRAAKLPFSLAWIDCVENKPFCRSVGVTGFPMVMYKRGANNLRMYGGGREPDDIMEFVELVSREPLAAMKVADVKRHILVDDVACVVDQDSAIVQTIAKAASMLQDVVEFAVVDAEARRALLGTASVSEALVCFFDGVQAALPSEQASSPASVFEWIRANDRSPTAKLTPAKLYEYSDRSSNPPLAMLIVDEKDEAELALVRTVWKGVAEARSDFVFAWLDKAGPLKRMVNKFELARTPAIVVADSFYNVFYAGVSGASAHNVGKINAFLDRVAAGDESPRGPLPGVVFATVVTFLWRWAYVLSALGTMLVLYIAYTIYVAYREAKLKRD